MVDGLERTLAQQRLLEYGPNALPEVATEPLWQKLQRQFQSPLIYILLFALAVDLTLWFNQGRVGVPWESVAIGLILVLNAGLGVYQESKAEQALARLKQLATPRVWVCRSGSWEQVPSQNLVPGDLVRLEAGDRVPADGQVATGESLAVDESMLTGESLPQDRATGAELSSGTLVVRGRAFLVLTRTGPTSALGQLARLLGSIVPEPTPLEKRLKVFGDQVAFWILVLAAVLVGVGLWVDGPSRLGSILLFAVALAVAAIPEGLPAVLTLTLALGVERMATQRAVVRRLSAVEALGSVTVIATDKTGTLTENRIQVQSLDVPDLPRALQALALANDAEAGMGDPLDVALLEYVRAQGPINSLPRQSVRLFDSAWGFMRVSVLENGGTVSYLKGAPEILLERSRLTVSEREHWQERAEIHARKGFRVLGIATAQGESEQDLELLGLVLFWDPPRPEVASAIDQARAAGIRVLMITGDHPATALAIAEQIGIPGQEVLTGKDLDELADQALIAAIQRVNIFARTGPEHKLRLVTLLQAAGAVVAMTGDGVNDAPALKRSDVGVAMGMRGSDVTREVADLVLLDDNFATIVAAVEEGRSIYENIQKFLGFLFAANLALILLVVGGMAGAIWVDLRTATGALVLPLTAVQLLWINFVTNGPPALALGLDANPDVMKQSPRATDAPLLDRSSIGFIGLGGGLVGGISLLLLILLPKVGLTQPEVYAAVFLYVGIASLMLAYPVRSLRGQSPNNPWVHGAVGGGIILQTLAVAVAWLRTPLELEALPLEMFIAMFVAGLLTWGLCAVLAGMQKLDNAG